MAKHVFIGIDPGTTWLGYAFIERISGKTATPCSLGTIALSHHLTMKKKLYDIFCYFRKKLVTYAAHEYRISVIIEDQYVAKNVKSSFSLVMVRAVFLLLSEEFSTEYTMITATQARATILGNGSATKEEVARYFSRIFPTISFETADESDAFLLAFYGYVTMVPAAILSR